MLHPSRPSLLATALVLWSAPLASADGAADAAVTVTSTDGEFTLSGELLSYDATSLLIRSDLGHVRLARADLTCEGAACPTAGRPGQDLSVAVTDPGLIDLLQALADRFATGAGMTALTVPAPGGSVERIEIFHDLSAEGASHGIALATMPPEDGISAVATGEVALAVGHDAQLMPATVRLDDTDPAPQQARVIALDAMVPVVHPDNGIRGLSIEHLAQIAAGQITRWSDVGGADRPIQVILPARGTALDRTLVTKVMAPSRIRARGTDIRRMSGDPIPQVMQDPGALAFVTRTTIGAARAVPIRQACGPLSRATEFAIKSEEYPLTRRIISYNGTAEQAGLEASFVDYLATERAQRIVADIGFVDQAIITEPLVEQGGRMTAAVLGAESGEALEQVQTLARMLAEADRVSTTFRFEAGSLDLDAKAQDDIGRLVAFLNGPQARDRDILILGFTDAVGRFDLNYRIADLRARKVMDELIRAPGGAALEDRIEISAFGPLAPIGCNDTASGRKTNRRVEIWLR